MKNIIIFEDGKSRTLLWDSVSCITYSPNYIKTKHKKGCNKGQQRVQYVKQNN